MSSAPTSTSHKSGWPWWIDPYSDNPIAFGLLFALLVACMIGILLLYRLLFIHEPGMQPIPNPSILARGLLAGFWSA